MLEWIDQNADGIVPAKGTVLGFDFGEQRIGVANLELELGITHPLCTITGVENTPRFQKIQALLQEWRPVLLVVGLPVHMDGTPHTLTALSRKFAQRLWGRFNLPVVLVDERLTSHKAQHLLDEIGLAHRQRKPVLDQVAAQQILTRFFEAR